VGAWHDIGVPPGHESAEPLDLDLSPRGWLRPRAGDQAPGGRLVDPETGNPVLLHDVFRGPRSTLLLFGGADTAVTGAVCQAADAGLVACATILRPGQPPGRGLAAYLRRITADPDSRGSGRTGRG
jgi:hypothetical protein